MISRGCFITLTGLLLLGGAPAALAQPVPESAPVPVVRATAPTPVSDPTPVAVPVPVPVPPSVEHWVGMPRVAFPRIEIPPVDFDLGFAYVFEPMQIDSLEIEQAVEKARVAVEWIGKDERFKDLGEKVRKDVERAKWDVDRVRDLAAAKALKVRGLEELYVPRFGAQPGPQPRPAVRIFERCDTWRGGNNSDEIESRYYDCGRNAVDQSQWERAVDYFGRAASVKGTRADGALYWKAWAQNRLGQRAEALTTLGLLKSAHAKSRWVNDASALEVEIRQRTGQSVDPAATQDDELQLIALNALRDKPSAVPMLEKFLQGPRSPKLKERALFVLAQNESPGARAILAKVARGEANPELQLKALQYLGHYKSVETRDILGQAYKSSADATVKRAILRAYASSQDRERLLDAARSETDATLRLEAVRQLGNLQAGPELADIYKRESSADVKKQILRALANSNQVDRLVEIGQAEQDPELKRTAIRALGLNRNAQTGTQLLAMYDKDANRVVREAVIDALFVQGNGAGLVSLAKREKDLDLKRRLVEKLSVMRDNAEAEAYLLELLK